MFKIKRILETIVSKKKARCLFLIMVTLFSFFGPVYGIAHFSVYAINQPQNEQLKVNNPIMIYGYQDLAKKENEIYMVSSYSDLAAYDVTNNSAPYEVDEFFGIGFCNQIEIIKNQSIVLYSETYSPKISLYNNTNYNWSLLSELSFDYENEWGHPDISNLIINQSLAFVCINFKNRTTQKLNFLLSILDFSNSSQIQQIGNFTSEGFITDLCLYENRLYLTNSKTDLYNYENEDWVLNGQNEIMIINVMNVSNPLLENNRILEERPSTIFVQEDYIYIGYFDVGFEIFYNDGFNIESFYKSIIEDNITKIKVRNGYMYALCSEGLRIINITDKSNIEILGGLFPRFIGSGVFFDFIIDNDLVYAVREVIGYNYPFYVFNCTDKSNPTEIYPLVVKQDQKLKWILKIALLYTTLPIILTLVLIGSLVKVIRIRLKRKTLKAK